MGGHREELAGPICPLFLVQFGMMILGRDMTWGQVTQRPS